MERYKKNNFTYWPLLLVLLSIFINIFYVLNIERKQFFQYKLAARSSELAYCMLNYGTLKTNPSRISYVMNKMDSGGTRKAPELKFINYLNI